MACVWFITMWVREVLSITKDGGRGTTLFHLFHSKNWGPDLQLWDPTASPGDLHWCLAILTIMKIPHISQKINLNLPCTSLAAMQHLNFCAVLLPHWLHLGDKDVKGPARSASPSALLAQSGLELGSPRVRSPLPEPV